MKKFFAKRLKNEKGLTLIELLAVIVILAIIAAIAVPSIGNVIANSKQKAVLADASNILSGAKLAVVDGVCDGLSSGTKTCNQDNMKEYVEGVPTGATYLAEKSSAGIWSVTYSEFAKVTKDPFKADITTNKITESNLIRNMGGK